MNPFIRKLRHGARLTERDEAVLTALAEPARRAARDDITPRSIVLVLEGWVCRYKQLENGKQQITSLFLPGDLCEPFGAFPSLTDYSLTALTPVLLARVPPQGIRSAARSSPVSKKRCGGICFWRRPCIASTWSAWEGARPRSGWGTSFAKCTSG